MRLLIMFGLIFLVLLTSCEKSKIEFVEFTGIVTYSENKLGAPNVLTKLHLSSSDINIDEFSVQTYTDSNGFYDFSINPNGYTSYYVKAYKEGYAWEYPFGCARAFIPRQIKKSAINSDSVSIGIRAVLKASVSFPDNEWTYILKCNVDKPAENNDSSSCYNPWSYNLDYGENPAKIIRSFLFIHNHQVYISWYKFHKDDIGFNDTVFSEDITIINLVPMDTSYIEISLE